MIFRKAVAGADMRLDSAKTKSDLESLADNDIHRLVRVTAHKELISAYK